MRMTYGVLPPEPPGEPLPGKSWDTARRIARDYDFADPSIVTGVFDREEPLEDRTMLLILHFPRLQSCRRQGGRRV